nr:aromatic acid/H+ symport family MFS transporter [Azotobacter vinelandii]WKN24491.1 aromatic acid/H+ symport family MFS transporter [Azotobacter vinelandii]
MDVRELINGRPFGGFQKLVVFFCFVIIALDGFDVAVMGLIAPQLREDWGVTPQELGPVLSAALVGLAIGALVAGPLADRYGRKIVLVSSVLFFGFWTLVTAFSGDVGQLVIFRFLTGLGLGAAMPNAATLTAEFAPERKRAFLVTVAFCGFSFGAAGGGFLSAWMIPNLGWQSVLVMGGVLPLLVVPLMLWKMPESLSFLVSRRAPRERIRRIVERVAPGVADGCGEFTMPSAPQQLGGVRLVLSSHYRFGTLMLWVGYFTVLFLVYLFSSWLPTLVRSGGYSVTDAAIVTSMFQVGGPIGALCVGWAMDRFRPHGVLLLTMLVAALAIGAIGQAAHDLLLLGAIAWAVGFCLNGGSVGMNAMATCFYPTEARATGACWMSGVGRFGAILSAFAGGQMIAMGLPLGQMFVLLAVPAVVSGLALAAKGLSRRAMPHLRTA